VSASETDKSTFTATISSPMPLPPRDNLNPINGELYTAKEFSEIKSKYPIAVVIENHVDARPQSGYNSADLVFETLAEGGITRTLAIFWGKDCPEMGPIRSARQYFLEWLVPFDPVFMFIGYAYSDSGDLRVDSGANMVSYGIKRLDTAGSFWRSNQRAAPHNAYSSSATLYQKADALGFTGSPNEIESWKFKKDAPIDSRGTQTIANIIFMERLHNAGRYDVKWVYDRERNVYLRSNGNTPYTDANTGAQVYAKNVIIQRVEMISTFDFAAHIIITTIGSGDAVVLRDGQVINGTWEKETLYTRTRYLDAGGNEIELNRGNTWVEGVPIDQGSVQIDN
ncbi:MAG: DUF3048 domain-containing protein, partial [Patescibacteria group bacterium]|nr:DUF3048 domain-containing protein [Patescibacteria group bacterium]